MPYLDGKETITIRIDLTDEEKNELREQYIDKVLAINNLKDQIKELNRQAKLIAEENSEILDRVFAGYEDVTMDLEYENDFETRTRNYYNPSGQLMHSRKLKPSENQETFLKAINS